ncbi:luciferase-like domain-containing protein [Aspergillus karnatakaensis]|uniref:luciferase-like domain-containing protein n=1 Tax=Aspergillus karnatakaensis TaxID=1810916 RepID=UPI003CCE3FCB
MSLLNTQDASNPEAGKKKILLNAFDIFGPGMLSPGQWKNPADRGLEKFDISFWVDYAKLLEKGGFFALFLADTLGGYDVYGGSIDETVRRATQYPVLDPSIPVAAMAAVTKRLSFAITSSTSHEPPFLLARRFSTLDHLTNGRFGWNIVTGWKKSAFQAIGLDEAIDHDLRYKRSDEYLRVLYKLWEGSWSPAAEIRDAKNDIYADPALVRTIKHEGQFYKMTSKHMVPPSPQRTPFLFQAGTSGAGMNFASTHAEAAFVGGNTPAQTAPKVAKLRAALAEKGRDPRSLKVFISLCPILGRTDDEAREKVEDAKKYASVVGGLVHISGVTGIDLSKVPLDEELSAADAGQSQIRTHLDSFVNSAEGEKWTPRKVSEFAAIGGLAPLAIGSPKTVADVMERWIDRADIDGFNLVSVVTPQSFEDVVELLVPELRRRGLYAELSDESLTTRERVYGKGRRFLADDHVGSTYRYDVYKDDLPRQYKEESQEDEVK